MEVESICVKSLFSLKASFNWNIKVSFVFSKHKLWRKSLFCFPGYGIIEILKINVTQAGLYPEANQHSSVLDSLRSRDAVLWLLRIATFLFLF